MTSTHTCPCCAHDLLRHVRLQEVYWFCTNCYQEMPILEHQYSSAKDNVVATEKLFSSTLITAALAKNYLLATS